MENIQQPTPEISATPDANVSSTDGNNTLVWIIIGAIALYWYYKTTQKKKEQFVNAVYENDNKVIDSFSKFVKTPLGTRYEGTLLKQRVKPSYGQLLKIDRFLQSLSKYEHTVLLKASQFERRVEVERALSIAELGVYLKIRKRLMEIMESIMNR